MTARAAAPVAGTPDETFMRRALELARLGWGRVSPNPMVGAVVVKDGAIVGEGAHREFGGPHAEVEALAAAGARARGATLYVTLEPCAHHGKTPPCVDAILAAGISRVVAAVRDPNPEAGDGARRLGEGGVSVEVGLLQAEAEELNAAFLNQFAANRPWVTLKLAVSLDGAIASAGRVAGWITGPESRRQAHVLRAGHDAVGVGMGTVLADDPQLTVRDVPQPRVPPARVVFSRSGRLPLTAKLAQRPDGARIMVTAQSSNPNYDHALQQLGVEVLAASSLREGLELLKGRGIQSILVEGGAGIAGSLIADDLVDRLVLFQAPTMLGRGALNAFSALQSFTPEHALRWRFLSEERMGADRMLVLAREGR